MWIASPFTYLLLSHHDKTDIAGVLDERIYRYIWKVTIAFFKYFFLSFFLTSNVISYHHLWEQNRKKKFPSGRERTRVCWKVGILMFMGYELVRISY